MHSSIQHAIRQWLSPKDLTHRSRERSTVSDPVAKRELPVNRPALRWHVLLIPLFFIPLVSYWLIGPTYLTDWRTFLGGTVLNYTLSGCCVLVLNYLTQLVIQQYPSLTQVWSRVWRMLLVFGLVTPAFLLLGIFIYEHFHLFGYQHEPGLTTKILLYNALVNVISVGIDETVYSLTKWRESLLEQEKLKEVTLQSQYESLKHQVNPHFLFNSLNSLSSLIADEPEQAEEFLYEMANVYRYLLQTNKATGTEGVSELTTLETELKFIDSYYHLLKTRYRAGIDLKVDIAAPFLVHRLPPLTLQMLVENAVKHNVVAANKPLQLEISAVSLPVDPSGNTRQSSYADKANEAVGWLIVRNNLQRKNNRMASNHIGLSNIAAKYRLLAQPEPIIRDDDGYFTVMLSLFAPGKS